MQKQNLVHISDGSFDKEVLQSETPVLADFYADWCGPCRAIAPTIEKLSDEYSGKVKFVKVNTDENQELAMKYEVMSIPTVMIFKDGKVVNRVVGALPESQYRKMLTGVE